MTDMVYLGALWFFLEGRGRAWFSAIGFYLPSSMSNKMPSTCNREKRERSIPNSLHRRSKTTKDTHLCFSSLFFILIMIFSSPFWIPAVLITLVKIILSGTIGAIISLYVRRSRVSGYASSIRWSRTGGVLEAGILLWNSLRQLPARSSIAMAIVIFASLFTLVVSILLGALVSRAEKSFNEGSLVVYTEQLMSTDPIFWTASMEADVKMNETLISTLNDTRRNPNPVPRTRYTPRTYAYEIACDETMVIFGSSLEDILAYPPILATSIASRIL